MPNITSGTDWVLAIGGNETNPVAMEVNADGCLTTTVASTVQGHDSNRYTLPYSRIDASLSNLIYGNSSTVQPLSINCYLMFYIN